jgi:hypothetical protein
VPKECCVPESSVSTPGSSGLSTNVPFGRPLIVMSTRCFAPPGRETLPKKRAYAPALCPPDTKRPPPPVIPTYWPVGAGLLMVFNHQLRVRLIGSVPESVTRSSTVKLPLLPLEGNQCCPRCSLAAMR